MPELPEVETIARTLAPLVRSSTITEVQILLPKSVADGSLPLQQVCGRRITHVGRRGKLVLLHLAPHTHAATEACTLAVHLKMTGRLFVYAANKPANTHTRVILQLHTNAGARQLFFDDTRTFGFMRLVSPASLPTWDFWTSLGPEPLDTPLEQLAGRLTGRRHIKAVLLDQKVVAGIGNIYADEALFRAGVHPTTPAGSLSPAQKKKLFACVAEVLRESIDQCGSSIRDYRTAQGDAGAFQNYFRVYGRGGQQCVVCGHTLKSCKVGGRMTVFCPHCQILA